MTKQDALIFLSYAREDESVARKIYKILNGAGLNIWFDKVSMLPGQKWKSEIRKAIRKSDYFIALLSTKSVSKRGFVQSELKVALELLDEFPEPDIFIIPTRIEECDPQNEKIIELNWVDLFPIFEDGIIKMLRFFKSQAFVMQDVGLSEKLENAIYNHYERRIELLEHDLEEKDKFIQKLMNSFSSD